MADQTERTAEPQTQVDAIRRAVEASKRVIRGVQATSAEIAQRRQDVPLLNQKP